jgi:hypothetical protein
MSAPTMSAHVASLTGAAGPAIYVPLPADVVKQIEDHWSKEISAAWKTAEK